MPNAAQILFALAMVVWVVDVRFAPKAQLPQIAAVPACHGGPSSDPPPGADFEVVVCAQRGK